MFLKRIEADEENNGKIFLHLATLADKTEESKAVNPLM